VIGFRATRVAAQETARNRNQMAVPPR